MGDETTITPAATTTVAVAEAGDGTTTVVVTPAHAQQLAVHLLTFTPGHLPREGDPHYIHFHQAQARLKALGRLRCFVCGKDEAAAGQPIELHHSLVEFSLANGVDIDKFEEAFPEFGLVHGDEEAFLNWVESPGNLLCLCKLHHTGVEGIHSINYPIWECLRYWRSDLPLPGVVEVAGGVAGPGAAQEG